MPSVAEHRSRVPKRRPFQLCCLCLELSSPPPLPYHHTHDDDIYHGSNQRYVFTGALPYSSSRNTRVSGWFQPLPLPRPRSFCHQTAFCLPPTSITFHLCVHKAEVTSITRHRSAHSGCYQLATSVKVRLVALHDASAHAPPRPFPRFAQRSVIFTSSLAASLSLHELRLHAHVCGASRLRAWLAYKYFSFFHHQPSPSSTTTTNHNLPRSSTSSTSFINTLSNTTTACLQCYQHSPAAESESTRTFASRLPFSSTTSHLQLPTFHPLPP